MHNDNTLHFSYNPVNNKERFLLQAIGPDAWHTIDVKDYTDTDANTIYVNTSTGSDSNAGTEAAPLKTWVAGANLCTAVKEYVIVLNDCEVSEDFSLITSTYFQGFKADTGITARYTLRTISITPDDTNCIWVDKTGSDSNPGTEASPMITLDAANTACSSTGQYICINDSGDYMGKGFIFTAGCLGLIAALGCKPTFTPTPWASGSDYSVPAQVVSAQTIVAAGGTTKCIKLANGTVFILYLDTYELWGKFVNDAGTVLTTVQLTTGSSLNYPAWLENCIQMDNGNIFIVSHTGSGNPDGRFLIIDTDGAVVKAWTIYKPWTNGPGQRWANVVQTTTNEVIICYNNPDDWKNYCQIFDHHGTQTTSEKLINTSLYVTELFISPLNNGNFVLAYNIPSSPTWTPSYTIIDSAGDQVKAETNLVAAGIHNFQDCYTLANGNFVLAWYTNTGGVSNDVYFIILDEDGGVVKAAGLLVNDGIAVHLSQLPTNDILVFCNHYSVGIPSYLIISEDGNTVRKALTAISVTDQGAAYDVAVLDNGNAFFIYMDLGPGWPPATSTRYSIYSVYTYTGFSADHDILLNGITFDADDIGNLTKIFTYTSGKPTIKYCDWKGCMNPANDLVHGWTIYGDYEADIQNNLIHENDGGVYIDADVALLKNNLFYWNQSDYAIHINGAATSTGDISIEHNTIYDNYAGIRLEDNSGLETLKNNILNDDDVIGVNATTTLSQTYTICTDNNTNCAAGTGTQNTNPLFSDTGELIPADIDITLKKVILGDFADSPAKGLADDGTDAGCYHCLEIGDAETWTTFSTAKPSMGVKRWIEPASANKAIAQDGTPSSSNEGWTEYLEITYKGIYNVEYNNIILMLLCDNPAIRVYFDPTTSPNTYVLFTLIYEKLSASASQFRLNEAGKNDVVIKAFRKYEG